MNILGKDSIKTGVESTKIYGNSRNHSNFETPWLHDAFDFFNVQTSYDYLLPELRPFPGSIHRGNRGTRLEIARECAFENGSDRSGDVRRPNMGSRTDLGLESGETMTFSGAAWFPGFPD